MDNRIPHDIAYRQSNEHERIDVYLNVLSSRHRRQTLRYLRTTEQSTVDEITEHLDTHDVDMDVEDLRIELVHKHLPALDEYGLISFDHRSKRVSSESIPEPAEDVLELTQNFEKR